MALAMGMRFDREKMENDGSPAQGGESKWLRRAGVNPKLAVFKGQEAGFSDIVWLRIAFFGRTMWIQKGEVIMAFILEIPEDILDTLKVPRERAVQEIKKELAFLLYQRGLASMGVARRFSGMDKWAFLEGLAERGLVRHYTERELQEDIDYARSGE